MESGLRCARLYLSGFGWDTVECVLKTGEARGAKSDRTILTEGALILPGALLEQGGEAAIAAAAHALAHLRFSTAQQPVGKRKPLHIAVLSLVEDARVERLLGAECPGLMALWKQFHVAEGSTGALDMGSLAARLARALADPGYEDPNYWVNKGRELFERVWEKGGDAAAFREVGNVLANDLGQMRVRFEPQAYVVEPGYRDDHTFLWALDNEPDLSQPEQSLAQNAVKLEVKEGLAERVIAVSPVEAREEKVFYYPEWDFAGERFRENWARVVEESVEPNAGAAKEMTLRRGGRGVSLDTRVFMLDRAIQLRRQFEGEQLDLTGAIDARIQFRAGVSPEPRVFQKPGRRRRQTSVLVLMDLSESSNDRVPGTFQSVLDVEKAAVSLLVQAMDLERDRLGIHGFQSDGRQRVQYRVLKGFERPFGENEAGALKTVRGELSTRMGAAIRHAGEYLVAERSEKKVLFVLSDGQPSDVDVAEDGYLVEDAREAALALERRGVRSFCLTLDRKGDEYVRRIFGRGRYLIVDNALKLPQRLVQALGRVAEY